ncbi:hypothetical protein WMY93_015776 [Mugilogobius chulae]|uniref:Uncharacterized protein n=1 Tax=Mugilogobius chulae TaxID=88201 RepID=A0AAW0NVP8_9GOBI
MADTQPDVAEAAAGELTVASLEATLQKFFAKADKQAEERFERLESQFETLNVILAEHTKELESQRKIATSLQAQMKAVGITTAKHDEMLKQLLDKITSQEDRMRRENLRIRNLKEGEEQGNALAYLMRSFPKWFPEMAGNPPAHRIGPPRKSPDKPRTMILKCLRFTDRDRILQSARKNDVEVAGQKLRFTPDFSDATAQRRRPCYPVMDRARRTGLSSFSAVSCCHLN